MRPPYFYARHSIQSPQGLQNTLAQPFNSAANVPSSIMDSRRKKKTGFSSDSTILSREGNRLTRTPRRPLARPGSLGETSTPPQQVAAQFGSHPVSLEANR